MIGSAISAHIPAGRAWGIIEMEGKARFIFPVLISFMIVFVVSAVVTFTNIGFRPDYVSRWMKAFITGWPVGAVLTFFVGPYVRRATAAIVRLLDGPSPAP